MSRPLGGNRVRHHDVVAHLVVAGLDVPLPLDARRIGDPGLGLVGEAAHGLVDTGGAQPRRGETLLSREDLLLGLGLDSEMVDRPSCTGCLEEHQLQGWFIDGEVGVAVTPLGRFNPEEPRVEVDRLVNVFNVEGQL